MPLQFHTPIGFGCQGMPCQSGSSSVPSPSLPSLERRPWVRGDAGGRVSLSSQQGLSSSVSPSHNALDLPEQTRHQQSDSGTLEYSGCC